MKKTSVLTLILLAACAAFVAGQEVAETELLSVKGTTVEFINYEGPHSKIETLEEIMGIGIYLGNAIGKDYSTADYAGKYRVIHAVGESVDEGLEADIFMVLRDAEVDHIRNMRYMLAGFLMAAYDFSQEDALLLAEFVTIYNAVYRGKMDFFGGKYRQIVTRNLNPEAAGISTIYTDWPGKTEMLIPLTEKAAEGGLGSLSTDTLTGKEVIDQMRTQPDMGLDSRKDITELKEREVEQEQQKIEAEQQAIDQERQQIASEQQRVQEERAQVAEDRAQATTDEEKAQADERAAALDRQGEQLQAQEAQLNERQQDVAAKEQQQAERVDQIQQEREQIASDERALMDQQAAGEDTAIAAAAGARNATTVALYLEIREMGGEPLGRLVYIDSASGAITDASTLNTIRNRLVVPFGQNYVVIAGTTSGQGAVRLMTVAKESLATGREGEVDIYPGSELVADGAYVFAVTGDGGSWKVGKFDNSLALREVSDLEIYKDTSFSVAGSLLYVVGADGAIHALSTVDLTDTGTIR